MYVQEHKNSKAIVVCRYCKDIINTMNSINWVSGRIHLIDKRGGTCSRIQKQKKEEGMTGKRNRAGMRMRWEREDAMQRSLEVMHGSMEGQAIIITIAARHYSPKT
jgi:hypothetical protein